MRRRLAVLARKFVDPCGALGTTGNCQVGVSVHAVTESTGGCSCRNRGTTGKPPTTIPPRRSGRGGGAARSRRRCGIWRSDGWSWTCSTRSTASGGLSQWPMVAEFRLGLTERGLTEVLAVSLTATVHRADAVRRTGVWVGNGRLPGPRYADKPADLKPWLSPPVALQTSSWSAARIQEVVREPDHDYTVTVARAEGPAHSSQHPPRRRQDLARVPAEWPPTQPSPPITANSETALAWTTFEGCAWLGWHRHVILAAVAQTIHGPARTPGQTRGLDRRLPHPLTTRPGLQQPTQQPRPGTLDIALLVDRRF